MIKAKSTNWPCSQPRPVDVGRALCAEVDDYAARFYDEDDANGRRLVVATTAISGAERPPGQDDHHAAGPVEKPPTRS